MAWDGVLSRTEGSLLLLGAVVYTVSLVRLSRRESSALKREFSEEYSAAALGTERSPPHATWNTLLLLAGIALTVLGAELLVSGAVSIAQAWGVSDAIIGLTIVAIGTSAPELATTVMATSWAETAGANCRRCIEATPKCTLEGPQGGGAFRLWLNAPYARPAPRSRPRFAPGCRCR
jgi:Ca2+/Na+ antiporter